MLGVISELEIVELTGRKRRDKQIEELHSMGVRFLVRSDGSLVIARAHIEGLLGVTSKRVREPEREPQINFSGTSRLSPGG